MCIHIYMLSNYDSLVLFPSLSLMARTDTPLSSVFSNDFWGLSLSDPESHKSYRPLTILSFRLNRILHGMWAPGFHVINIAAHALVSVLFLQFCLKLGVTMWTGVAASLLFVAHPIHTETVCFWLHMQCFLFLFYPQKGNKNPLQDACLSAICSSLIPRPVCAGNKAISIAALVCIYTLQSVYYIHTVMICIYSIHTVCIYTYIYTTVCIYTYCNVIIAV